MNSSQQNKPAHKEIDAIIMKLTDWRGEKLTQLRALIKQADPDVTEEVKWKKASNPDGIPVWYHDGMICTGEIYKNHLRLTFSKGKSLNDPQDLLNAHRAMIINEGDAINEAAFKDLIYTAVKLNQENKNKP